LQGNLSADFYRVRVNEATNYAYDSTGLADFNKWARLPMDNFLEDQRSWTAIGTSGNNTRNSLMQTS
jgi:hypothetical protein